ncbi:alpha/beta hydrolase family protein [Terrimonas pollutisoli]|uniref:alpha/beta hydrolase family protein n=1 Tax=Terrimonas pollutisoli TaxID=3034147 RepID=UPI0023EC1489|nr:prolyl oligopeptidase family serine peptidase [Terrimonas sp. H1YJ31]
MKNFILIFLIFGLTFSVYSQTDGKIIERKEFVLPDSVKANIKERFDEQTAVKILNLKYYRITYLSDGLKVTAYSVEPNKEGKYPCIISNRGGSRDFGQWSLLGIGRFLGVLASWDYIIIASQFRGNDGGDGIEEFGGKDINDVLNLIPVLGQIPNADTSRIGIEGTSRGGMMTYLALKKTCVFKAAVVTAGLANAFNNISSRPEMEKNVFSQLVPNYWAHKEIELKERSAVFWADKICNKTPLLIMHGSSDWRVLPSESLELVNKLYQYKHPTRFILYEGADHGITEFRDERLAEMKKHFDYYVRDNKKLPDMVPHGR